MSLLTYILAQFVRRHAEQRLIRRWFGSSHKGANPRVRIWLKPLGETVRGANLSTAIPSRPEGVSSLPLGVSIRFTQQLAAWKPGEWQSEGDQRKVGVHYVLVTTYTHKHTEKPTSLRQHTCVPPNSDRRSLCIDPGGVAVGVKRRTLLITI